jgi:hypothetical protein
MVLASNYRITIQDYSVVAGSEHYVVGVERLDTTANKFTFEII